MNDTVIRSYVSIQLPFVTVSVGRDADHVESRRESFGGEAYSAVAYSLMDGDSDKLSPSNSFMLVAWED